MNQIEYIFWKYNGTGNRSTRRTDWISNVHKDFLNNILNNKDIILLLSLVNNTSPFNIKTLIINSWFVMDG
uniref:mRNA splicing factor 3b5 n=1 Tax=Amorphochlora amoebiformis TaxID=1561963 RepID=A0A0H5BIT9_9EUKA|nr:mRNA splicing factor 3b5 [Amorphochlora amoebiformis]